MFIRGKSGGDGKGGKPMKWLSMFLGLCLCLVACGEETGGVPGTVEEAPCLFLTFEVGEQDVLRYHITEDEMILDPIELQQNSSLSHGCFPFGEPLTLEVFYLHGEAKVGLTWDGYGEEASFSLRYSSPFIEPQDTLSIEWSDPVQEVVLSDSEVIADDEAAYEEPAAFVHLHIEMDNI